MKIENTIKRLEMIAQDMENDAKEFDGKPFDGKTVAAYFGYQGAAIAALAKTLKEMLATPAPVEPASPVDRHWETDGDFLKTYLIKQIEWSERTFGNSPRSEGICKHIEKELAEIRAKPHDLGEWIDVVILALDGAWRAGYSPDTIIGALEYKQEVNFKRQWGDLKDQDESLPTEHIKKPASPVAKKSCENCYHYKFDKCNHPIAKDKPDVCHGKCWQPQPVASPVANERKQGHSALVVDKETKEIKIVDLHPAEAVVEIPYDDIDYPLWVCGCGKKHSFQFKMCGACGGTEHIKEIPKPIKKKCGKCHFFLWDIGLQKLRCHLATTPENKCENFSMWKPVDYSPETDIEEKTCTSCGYSDIKEKGNCSELDPACINFSQWKSKSEIEGGCATCGHCVNDICNLGRGCNGKIDWQPQPVAEEQKVKYQIKYGSLGLDLNAILQDINDRLNKMEQDRFAVDGLKNQNGINGIS